MQPQILALIVTLAPLPAAAFGDLDCITFETCGNGGCGPILESFASTFDWNGEAASVDASGDVTTLPLMTRGEDACAVVLEYGDNIDAPAPTLRIESTNGAVVAYFTFAQSGWTTWVGDCNSRQAA